MCAIKNSKNINSYFFIKRIPIGSELEKYKIENEKLLNIDGLDELIDQDKERVRENEMLKNIATNIIESGVIVVITGTAHLNFFERNIKDAIFPFRNSHGNIA